MPDLTIPPGGALPPPGPPLGPPDPTALHVGSAGALTRTSASPRGRARRGRLSPAWHVAVVASWVGAFVAYLAVWKASTELGLATWWLGPRGNPQPLIVRLVPFLVTATFGILASYNVRRLPAIGLLGAALLAAIAVPDLSRTTGLATVEFAIAGAVALVAAASFTGTYRTARSDHAG